MEYGRAHERPARAEARLPDLGQRPSQGRDRGAAASGPVRARGGRGRLRTRAERRGRRQPLQLGQPLRGCAPRRRHRRRRPEEGAKSTSDGRLEGSRRRGDRVLPRGARARQRARAGRRGGEEGRGPRQGVREDGRPAALRRGQEGSPRRLGRRALPPGGREGRDRRLRPADRVRRRRRSPRARERDRQDRDLGPG